MVALTSDLCLFGVGFIEGVFIERIRRLLDTKDGARRWLIKLVSFTGAPDLPHLRALTLSG